MYNTPKRVTLMCPDADDADDTNQFDDTDAVIKG
jgi:hypothetical protein